MTKIASKFAGELASALTDAKAPTNQPSDNVKGNIDHFRHILETVVDADDTQETRSILPKDAADLLNEALEVLTEMNTDNAEALFISCTALPALGIIQELENKIKKIVLSSNQVLIWNSIRSVGYTSSIEGYGEILKKI